MIRSALIAGAFALSLAGPIALAQDAPNADQPSSASQTQDQDQTTGQKHKGRHHHQQQAKRDTAHSKATDQIADRLNACEAKPEDQRKTCLADAAKGG